MKYDTGDKFIIEIKDMEADPLSEYPYHLNSMRVSHEFLDPLEKFTGKTYEEGLADAWEVARKVTASEEDGGLSMGQLRNLFGDGKNIFSDFSAQDAVIKIKDFEADQIKFGDQVINVSQIKGLVLAVMDKGCENCIKRKEAKNVCPWDGTYKHKDEQGLEIRICNAYERELKILWEDMTVTSCSKNNVKKTGINLEDKLNELISTFKKL